MLTLKLFLIFCIKALIYGMGLCFGFWLAGKITGYIDFYVWLYFNEPETFKKEFKLERLFKANSIPVPN